MLIRTRNWPVKPPPHYRVDLTHPLGANCQAACLFNDGWIDGPINGGAGPIAGTMVDVPHVQFYQTYLDRVTYHWLSNFTKPVWRTNAAGRCIYYNGDNWAGMDVGFINGYASYDLSYPQFAVAGTQTCGQTVCIIRRKTDTTLRNCTLFGIEGTGGLGPPATARCGTHCPYGDGAVYWDYGGNTAPNRLVQSGLAWSLLVEKWCFTAGPRGSNFWRNGEKQAEQTTPITREVTANSYDTGGMLINGGNGLSTLGSNDEQEINFFMFIANQWTDEQVRWWMSEPYCMFYEPFTSRQYFFIGTAGGGVVGKTTEVFFN